ncbi:hypothetical protein BDV93DRAFT_551487 [Ceratobasidium sp. AG-I]|nr:hypothetical protein BDV93DRAFT_551487 [Ceratobasidium sp. AG-I]
MGRGDTFRLSPSLLEYKVLSSWKSDSDLPPPEAEGRVEYRGESFSPCFVHSMTFDHNQLDDTQTVKAGIYCKTPPVTAFLETTVVFSVDVSKDIVGQYYGYNVNLFNFIDETSRDYRKAVFAVLDVISTDSLVIMGGPHISGEPILTLSARIGEGPGFEATTMTYFNGTKDRFGGDTLGAAEIYRASITNLMDAVYDTVMLDLGNTTSDNIFINPSAVNITFRPNAAPASINPNTWVPDSSSFYYGTVVPPHQTWAEMLLDGLPSNITLGNLTGLPASSTMITNYLCSTYQRKQTSSFLADIFVGTATMILSAWGTWTFVSALIAKTIREPCFECKCGNLLDGDNGIHVHHDHERNVATTTGLVIPPVAIRTKSNTESMMTTEKDVQGGDSPAEAPIPEVPQYGPAK